MKSPMKRRIILIAILITLLLPALPAHAGTWWPDPVFAPDRTVQNRPAPDDSPGMKAFFRYAFTTTGSPLCLSQPPATLTNPLRTTYCVIMFAPGWDTYDAYIVNDNTFYRWQ